MADPRPATLRFALALTVSAAAAGLGGCVAVEAVAGALGGGPAEEAPVQMRYAGLEGRTVAVVASLDPALARRHPDLGPALAGLLADRFARHVPGALVLPPEEALAWQQAHPFWESVPPSRVTAGLGVQRLVRVEVAAWRTTQAGNAAVLEGRLDAAVQVYEAAPTPAPGSGSNAPGSDASGGGASGGGTSGGGTSGGGASGGGTSGGDPDRPVFLERVSVRFPEDSELGLPTLGDSGDPGPNGVATPSGPDQVAVGRRLLLSWVRRAGPLFYDQQEARERDRRRAEGRS